MQNDKNHTDEVTKMLIPIRCFTCGKPIAHMWEDYKEQVSKGEDVGKVMNKLGLDRYCCRGVFLGTVELIDLAGEFKRF